MFNETIHQAISRRSFIGSLAAGTATLPIAISGCASTPAQGNELRPLDVMAPRDNLYGFAKMWGTIGDKAVLSGYSGIQYAIVGSERAKPLFGYTGCGNIRNKILADGSVKITGKECGFFTDLANGEIIDVWDNLWTGERVKVFPFINDKLSGTLGLERKVFNIGDGETVNNARDEDKPVKGEPFLLPWQTVGDQYLLGWDYAHEYTNPVTPEGWPKASTGRRVNPSEHFTIFTPRNEMDDRSIATASFHAGFMRQAPWWPWMMMGQSGIDGVLMGRMHSYQITGGMDDVPKVVRERLERDYPEFFEEPVEGPDVDVMGTLEHYAQQVPPETEGYVHD